MIRASVDLPEPLIPTTATQLPASSVSETSVSARRASGVPAR